MRGTGTAGCDPEGRDMSPAVDPPLPTLYELGRDLLTVSARQRWVALVRPFLGIATYALAAWAGAFWFLPALVFYLFVTVVTVTHDVVHGALGLSRRQTEWALCVLGRCFWRAGTHTAPAIGAITGSSPDRTTPRGTRRA